MTKAIPAIWCAGLVLVISLLATTSSFGQQPSASDDPVQADHSQAPKYKIGRIFRNKSKRFVATHIIISIESTRLTRNEMVALAKQLNQDFKEENRFWVSILNNEVVALNVLPVGDEYGMFVAALQGTYYLNRSTGNEYIEFYSGVKNSNKIRINLKNTPASQVIR